MYETLKSNNKRMKEKDILVTQPFLPPLEEFIPYLEEIWDNKWLTNNGPLHQRLEQELADYLGVPFISLFANGTLALMTALQALDIKGEVITTPYTFVATSNAMVWNGITPVFVDVDPITGNLCPDAVQNAISHNTTAILPVHVYGQPCDKQIDTIAKERGVKVIYDAAHAFGVKENGSSVLNRGDLSILSFHATKVFNSFEGGAIISHTSETKQHIDDLKNFGFRGETNVVVPGVNAKMSEVHAAMGLLQLKYIDENIRKRKSIVEYYDNGLSHVQGIRLLECPVDCELNYAYFPIFIEDDFALTRDELYIKLKESKIFARRYFYPLVSDFSAYEGIPEPFELVNGRRIAEQVICLPIYPDLEISSVDHIINCILD